MANIETITVGNDTYALSEDAYLVSDNFSTTETKIGTWSDGSDLYATTYSMNTPSNTGSWVNFLSLPTGYIIRSIRDPMVYDKNATYWKPMNYFGSSSTYMLYRFKNNVLQFYSSKSDFCSTSSIFTLIYTK